MSNLQDFVEKKLIDGAGKEIGTVQGLNVTLPDYRIYLRVMGGKIREVRGRMLEFIPVSEIDSIGEEITLYNDFRSLKSYVKDINMENEESHKLMDLIGLEVKTSDEQILGKVIEIEFNKIDKKLFLIVAGGKAEHIWVKGRLKLPFQEIIEINEYLKTELEYPTLKKRIEEIMK